MDNWIAYIGVPVTVLVVIFALACVVSMAFSNGVKYPKQQEYTLDQKWDRGPLLFSATEIESIALPRHAEPNDVDGGSASAKW
ncbi:MULTISPECIES: aa3-type cytochrome oxidase subunit CtaJ [Gordonia]|uniref:Uncharacterized protein n=1 Tax=Gordonia sputi NBRC 100414 TaxID=1089453 RepID=H5U4M0_9ACTN|nr:MULTISPECIES: hypothetical protein [Gordonia]NKY94014.1 hypothetical protein [Gordonia sputi]OBA42241.1 hypothetical protein A5766_19675 [Gordonia sp. 852002-51296_SCH5728562-b]OBC08247.1 hypothetical protein A5785_06370 [Gordonia sp. 852002-50395_SCH5434458]OBC12769.1 hypothetical protein A5786_00395 [Gordonia sp. 852002-50816_SCH5313054-a]OBC18764.1 hypothetical protein A5788_00920 [Gordonia sp. 852002-50816_SCH5313054-c]